MENLKQGILTMGNMTISSKTTIDDMQNNDDIVVDTAILTTKYPVTIEGREFLPRLWFSGNRLENIMLSPLLFSEDRGKTKFEVCQKLLEEKLGKPPYIECDYKWDHHKGRIVYRYAWGSVECRKCNYTLGDEVFDNDCIYIKFDFLER